MLEMKSKLPKRCWIINIHGLNESVESYLTVWTESLYANDQMSLYNE